MAEIQDIPYSEVVRALSTVFSRLGVRGVLIGGVAVSLIAAARYTKDVDALAIADTGSLEPWLKALDAAGFAPLFDDPVAFAQRTRSLPVVHRASGTTVDIALGCMPYEEELVDRSTEHQISDYAIRLPTPEDLIILKAIAFRDQDIPDIKRIAEAHPNLDKARIRRVLTQFGELLYDTDRWKKIEPLLRS